MVVSNAPVLVQPFRLQDVMATVDLRQLETIDHAIQLEVQELQTQRSPNQPSA